MRLEPVLTLPDDDVPVMEQFGLAPPADGADQATRDAWYQRAIAYERLRTRLTSGQGPVHQFLGWPRSHQSSALVSFEIGRCERTGEYPDDDAIFEAAERWQLLLAMDHDDRLVTNFGDGGGLFIGVPADELARGDFSRPEEAVQSG